MSEENKCYFCEQPIHLGACKSLTPEQETRTRAWMAAEKQRIAAGGSRPAFPLPSATNVPLALLSGRTDGRPAWWPDHLPWSAEQKQPAVYWETDQRPAGWELSPKLRGKEPTRFRIVALVDLNGANAAMRLHGAHPFPRREHLVCEAYAPDACGSPSWHLVSHGTNVIAMLSAAVLDHGAKFEALGVLLTEEGCSCEDDLTEGEEEDPESRCFIHRVQDVAFPEQKNAGKR